MYVDGTDYEDLSSLMKYFSFARLNDMLSKYILENGKMQYCGSGGFAHVLMCLLT